MTEFQAYVMTGTMAWWAIAVPMVAKAADEFDRDHPWQSLAIFAAAIVWPITAVAFVPVVLVAASFQSAKNIRKGLYNRGVLREFEAWLDESEKGKICQKGDA